MAERVPCINPRCRRTFKDEGAEVICGKCFRALPDAMRSEHRGYWRELRTWKRRITRTNDELKISRMRDICQKLSFQLSQHWHQVIKPYLTSPEKPAGLEAFLQEMGL